MRKITEKTSFMQEVLDLDTQDLLKILVVTFGFTFVEDLRLVMTVVPNECGPWHRELVLELFSFVRKSALTETEVNAVDACLSGNFVPSPASCHHYKCVLDKLQHIRLSYGGCFSPPTSVCYRCGNDLVKNNKPSIVSFYTTEELLPMKKVDLRCRQCQINYGITKYGNSKDGYIYYPQLRRYAEASDVCFLDRLVMNMFASLR